MEETINICLDELYKNETLVSNFTKSELKTLLELATKNALFIFDNKYFHQIDGVAMGSPLGPCLANIFMNFYEKIWLDNCPEDIRPIFYRRYVDDIFILCKSEDHLIKFKEYLNSKHRNINFTHEFEEDGKLPFLDMIINRNHGCIQTSVYRKPTFTGVYTHFHSFLPSAYKFGLLSTLLFRYFSLCSSFKLFHLEVLEFKRIFQRNGYPLSIINGAIFKFLNKIFVSKVLIHTVPKREYVITLPYLGPLSNKIHKRIKTVFQRVIPTGKINLIFKTQRRISHFLRFKDVAPPFLSSHLIYHFKCPSCNAGYIGETRMHFKVRCSQHLGISEWTEKPRKGGVPTSITKHIKENNCLCSYDNFSIIGFENDYHRRLLKESLFIKLHDYELNGQQTSTKLALFS